jgi:hypothetical protein
MSDAPRVWEHEGDWYFLDDKGMSVNCNSKMIADYLTDIQDRLIKMNARIASLTEDERVELRRLLGTVKEPKPESVVIGFHDPNEGKEP